MAKKITNSKWYDIWERFKKGDTSAFEIIYNEHIDFLFNYGKSITANTQIIEDAVQDLFLYLLSKKDQITTPNYIQYYLLKAFKRILLEKIRTEKKSDTRIGDGIINFDFEIDTEGTTEKKIEERKIALIEDMIEKLDSKKKEVIFLRFQSGLSYAEISDIVGIQPSSAKQIVFRAISSFRKIIKDQIIEFLYLFYGHVSC